VGDPESSWTAQSLSAFDQAFQDAGLLGVTVCCASGDDGSTDGATDGAAHVDFPSSSPHALACGGTRLESTGTKITQEVVWNHGVGKGASGGGVSEKFPVPAYQAAAKVPASVNPSHFAGRGVPDISEMPIRRRGIKSVWTGRARSLGAPARWPRYGPR